MRHMEIFLLRHAETESNRAGSLSSGCEDTLTQLGHWQARAIVDGLMEFEIETILALLTLELWIRLHLSLKLRRSLLKSILV